MWKSMYDLVYHVEDSRVAEKMLEKAILLGKDETKIIDKFTSTKGFLDLTDDELLNMLSGVGGKSAEPHLARGPPGAGSRARFVEDCRHGSSRLCAAARWPAADRPIGRAAAFVRGADCAGRTPGRQAPGAGSTGGRHGGRDDGHGELHGAASAQRAVAGRRCGQRFYPRR